MIELYIHRLSTRLVMTSMMMMIKTSCHSICLICGMLCLTDVTIDTLYIFPKLSEKSTCFIRLWYMPPLYVATSVMLFSSVSYSGRSLARSVFEYCVELYMTLLFFLTTSSESLSFNVEPSDSRYALLLNVVGSSSACSFICSYTSSVILPNNVIGE